MPRPLATLQPPLPRLQWQRLSAPDAAARIEDDRDFALDAMDALSAVARAVNTSNDPALMIRKVAAALAPWLPFDALMLSGIEGRNINVIANSDPNRPPLSVELNLHSNHPLWPMLREEQPFDRPLIGTFHSAKLDLTYINVPLAVECQVYGVLHIDSYRMHTWSEDEVRLASLVAEHFGAIWQGALSLHRARERETQLAQALAVLGATQEAVAEGICLVNPRGELVSYNRRFAALWNIALEDADLLEREARLMPHVLAQLTDPDEFLGKISELYDNPHSLARDEIALRDGRVFERYSAPATASTPANASAGAGLRETNFGRIWTFSDISDRKRHEAQLHQQAFHDALTGLPNRTLLLQRLEGARQKIKRSGHAIALLFLDLDRFKIINDSLGHEAGDGLLRQVAARLQECLRPGDTAARFGGDEFVILLEQVAAPEEAIAVARRIAENLQRPFQIAAHQVGVTTSVGIAVSHSPDQSGDELVRNADSAMYRAKHSGKAQFHLWSENISQNALNRLQLEIELRAAPEHDQLEVWYQPILDLNDGERIAACEAMVRWRHPTRGLISPADFMPIAQESGLIVALDNFVLQRACAQTARWNAARPSDAPPLSVHVNLSARSFEQPDIAALLAQVLTECQLAPAQLVLEITESTLMRDTDRAIAQLHALKKLGVRIAIDDFGKGHSSLAHLESLPVDAFKIDRTFVARLAQGTAIVRAIVSLSQALKVEVVGEGVETPQQLEQLRALGCRWAQGFWFSGPLPAQDIAALMNRVSTS